MLGEFPELTKLRSGVDDEDSPDFRQLHDWVANFLAQPSDLLGRSGPVCPFTPPSMNRELLWVSRISDRNPEVDDVVAKMRDLVTLFHQLSPVDGPEALLRAVMVTFPEVSDYSVIDRIQVTLKPDFIRAGLMIGQFYPGCTEPGLWNADFRPLSSPIPLIAIRSMVSNDFPFLRASAEWIEIYLRRFAPTIPAPVRMSLAQSANDAAVLEGLRPTA